MIKPFKFLIHPLIYSHENQPIFAGEIFYAVPKYDIQLLNGKNLVKYKITMRFVHKKHSDLFKPDNENFWYFKYKENAEWLIDIWKGQDKLDDYYIRQRRSRTR